MPRNELAAFMAGVREVESNGDYRARNPSSGASGAYQFLDTTWNGYGGYRRAMDAPARVQDRRAAQLMTQYHHRYGRWDLVAVAWHGGPGLADRARRDPGALRASDGNITTAEYVRRVLAAAGLSRATGRGGSAGQTGSAGQGGSGGRPEDLRPWRLPSRGLPVAGRTVAIDPDRLHDLARQLTEYLTTVEAVYHRCRRAAAELAGGAGAERVRVADPQLQSQLRVALTRAVDDWEGLRRLPHLLTRDIGFVVEVRRRVRYADRADARRTVEGLIGALAPGHGSSARRHTAELVRQLFRTDSGSTHVRGHRPPGWADRRPRPSGDVPGRRDRDGTGRPDRGGSGSGRAPSLADVRLTPAWGGTKSIFDQLVTPVMRRHGVPPGTQEGNQLKRGYDTVAGPGMSDHYVGNRSAYAVDYPTYRGEAAARAAARALGIHDWRPGSYASHVRTIDGQRFSIQILWAVPDHHDHVHIGIRRL